MELATLVAKALLASAESTEVLGSLWNYIVVEVEVDTTPLGCDECVSDVSKMRGRWARVDKVDRRPVDLQ